MVYHYHDDYGSSWATYTILNTLKKYQNTYIYIYWWLIIIRVSSPFMYQMLVWVSECVSINTHNWAASSLRRSPNSPSFWVLHGRGPVKSCINLHPQLCVLFQEKEEEEEMVEESWVVVWRPTHNHTPPKGHLSSLVGNLISPCDEERQSWRGWRRRSRTSHRQRTDHDLGPSSCSEAALLALQIQSTEWRGDLHCNPSYQKPEHGFSSSSNPPLMDGCGGGRHYSQERKGKSRESPKSGRREFKKRRPSDGFGGVVARGR